MLTVEPSFGISRNVQQPGAGTSMMLGPPGTVTTGVDLPAGLPSTTNGAASRNTHNTLFVEPSTRGLAPATSRVAKTKAMASPAASDVQGTGHGSPFVTVHPVCAHSGGSALVSTVPSQPPETVSAAWLGVGLGAVLER